MTGPAVRAPGGAYEGAGRQAAVALRGFSSVIVTSDDPIAAAHVAIGIGLAESAHRLVMIGDLVGELAPLQSLLGDDDSHGIFDSFEFGTSFGRIAREVKGAPNLFVMPGGTESPASESIIGSQRWQHFASEFANADELLLLVVAPTAPGIAKLAAQVDGLVLVGAPNLEAIPDATVLTKVPHPSVIAPPRIDIRSKALRVPTAPAESPWVPSKVGIAAVLLLAAGIAGGALVARSRSASKEPVVVAAPPVDSVKDDSIAAARKASAAVVPVNPADSANATPFSVEILAANTAEGANFELKRHGSVMPSPTISLVPIGETEATWYKVYAGAYSDSSDAEKLVRSLRRRRIVADSAGSVARVSFAFLVDSVPAVAGVAAAVRDKIQSYAGRGIQVYGLAQSDGSVRLYTGAFERPEQSSLALSALRVAGLAPVLAYRTGRIP
ncbi:MAG TPA: SPOR domain-containing protein [Gemmatimonadaceae bacterium]|nr:SPOR domain-containing protein [Gemmatimonadaceae bacterium]